MAEETLKLTDEEWQLIQGRRMQLAGAAGSGVTQQRQSGAGSLLNAVLWLVALGAVVILALLIYERFLTPPPVALRTSPPTAAVSFVAPSGGGYAPQPAPQGSDPAPAADGAALVAPTPEPPPPTATPAPTADLAQQADVDALANAADEAAGGNPAAATPLPAGPVDLPTVEIRPVDPSGGDASTLARACANSGVKAGCEHPLTAEEIRQLACAMDLASSGQDCAPIEVRP